MKMEQTDKYLHKQQITYTKEQVEFSNNEIDDLFTPTQLILYAQIGDSRS